MNTQPATRPPGRAPAPIDLAELKRLAGLGMSVQAIADRFGLGRRTLFERMAADPGLRAAYDAGGAEAEERAVARLEKAALAGNLAADIFFLKARRAWKTDPQPGPSVVVSFGDQPSSIRIEDVEDMMAEQRALIEASADRGD